MKKEKREEKRIPADGKEYGVARFHRLIKARVRARSGIEHHFFVRYALLLLLPLLLAVFALTRWMIRDYEKEARNSLYASMDTVLEQFWTEVVDHLNDTTTSIASNAVFRNAQNKDLPEVFEAIRATLVNIQSGNRLFQPGGVAFYSATTPTLVYTDMGTFNEAYFRYYELENDTTVSIRTVLEQTDYIRLIPYHAVHTYYDSLPSLDVICALPKQPGSFMIYSVTEQRLREMLTKSMVRPESVFLVHENGYRLFPLDLETPPELERIYDLAGQETDHGRQRLSGARELLTVRAGSRDLVLAYVMRERDLYGSVYHLSNMLYISVALIGVLGMILITVLSFWNARPIREILFLTERLFPSEEEEQEQRDEAALDRIQTILARQYTDLHPPHGIRMEEGSTDAQPPVISESPDADLLLAQEEEKTVPPMEELKAEDELVRQILAFIDSNQDEFIPNVSMLADHFHMEISNLSHQFKNRTGYSLSDYLNARKLDLACTRLRETNLPVVSIAENLGYTHASSFIRMFKRVYGMTPTQFRCETQQTSGEKPADPLGK